MSVSTSCSWAYASPSLFFLSPSSRPFIPSKSPPAALPCTLFCRLDSLRTRCRSTSAFKLTALSSARRSLSPSWLCPRHRRRIPELLNFKKLSADCSSCCFPLSRRCRIRFMATLTSRFFSPSSNLRLRSLPMKRTMPFNLNHCYRPSFPFSVGL